MRVRAQAQNLRALSLAPAAQAWLKHTTSARVLHVFQRACNLANSAGDILALVAPEVGAGPFALVVSSDRVEVDFPAWMEAGDEVTVREGRLEMGPLVLDTRRAKPWQPRPPWEHLVGRTGDLKAQLPALKALLARHAPAESLAGLAANRPGHSDAETPDTLQARFLRAARPPVETLCSGLLTGDLEACRAGARGLAGLGGGLTPAGDDFLLGVLYALWATRPPAQVAPLAEAVLANALPLTSRLSGAWLKAAARGEAAQPWHALAEALARDDRPALIAAARDILGVGHTSGADALAGFVCALSLP